MSGQYLHRTLKYLFVSIFVLAPFAAVAAGVAFVTVMSDPAGSDTHHEWVRIHNGTGGPIDLKGWRFAEGGSNHKITALGTSIIPIDGYAIIADDAATYAAENTVGSDILFDSAFSLKNTGETIALKNASSSVVAEITYAATSVAPKAVAPKSVKNSAPKARIQKASPPVLRKATTTVATAMTAVSDLQQISTAYFDLWPWLAGLAGLILIGVVGLIMSSKKPTINGYTVVDITDKHK